MFIKRINLENGEGENLNIVALSEASGQIEAYKAAVISGLERMAQSNTEVQVAEIYLGNPSDTDYIDRPVQAIYMGSYKTLFNDTPQLHIWLHRSHEGTVQASSTYGPKNDRSTCGFLANNGWGRLGLSDETIQAAEKLLDEVAAKIAA